MTSNVPKYLDDLLLQCLLICTSPGLGCPAFEKVPILQNSFRCYGLIKHTGCATWTVAKAHKGTAMQLLLSLKSHYVGYKCRSLLGGRRPQKRLPWIIPEKRSFRKQHYYLFVLVPTLSRKLTRSNSLRSSGPDCNSQKKKHRRMSSQPNKNINKVSLW